MNLGPLAKASRTLRSCALEKRERTVFHSGRKRSGTIGASRVSDSLLYGGESTEGCP